MNKIIKLIFSLLLIVGFSTNMFANGLSLNSLGSKAFGMGGAFVGLANDATAIYWNPAGLAGQGNQLVAYYSGIMPFGKYTPTGGSELEMTSNLYSTGGLFATYAMDKLTYGFAVYVPAGLGAEWDPADFAAPASQEMLSLIGAVVISPTFAYQVNNDFSVGLAINITYAMFDLKQPGATQFEEESTGLGYGATIGLKYNVNEQLSLGASFRLATEVAMSGTAKNPGLAAFNAPTETDFDRDVTWPMWIAGGLAYKVNDNFTVTADAQYSQWSELDNLKATYDNATWQAVMSGSGNDELDLQWDDAVQIRVGGEYMLSEATALRAGYYYDPAPAPDETQNVLIPSSTNNVFTFGIGHDLGKYRVDLAAEYLLGEERNVAAIAANSQPGKHQLDIFAFGISFGMEL